MRGNVITRMRDAYTSTLQLRALCAHHRHHRLCTDIPVSPSPACRTRKSPGPLSHATKCCRWHRAQASQCLLQHCCCRPTISSERESKTEAMENRTPGRSAASVERNRLNRRHVGCPHRLEGRSKFSGAGGVKVSYETLLGVRISGSFVYNAERER